MAAPHLSGDCSSDAVAAQVGGMGIAPSSNMAVFEAAHGTAPKYTDRDKANPGPLLFSAIVMPEHLGWFDVAQAMINTYERTLVRKVVTYDLSRQKEGAIEVTTFGFGHRADGQSGLRKR